MRVNQPPVAIIRPATQKIHLPNSVAILDGLSSTDDSKIASYKWELMKGPISYQFEPKTLDTVEIKGIRIKNHQVKSIAHYFSHVQILWRASTPLN